MKLNRNSPRAWWEIQTAGDRYCARVAFGKHNHDDDDKQAQQTPPHTHTYHNSSRESVTQREGARDENPIARHNALFKGRDNGDKSLEQTSRL
jgi:hypothetical protein